MTGKAKPTAAAKKPTAAAKKPTAAAKKPTAKKPTAKKPTAKKPTAKKPTAKKPTAKKPTTAKFNLDKLMMLIVRGAPKKGKKMMGGYAMNPMKTIETIILNLIVSLKPKLVERINEIHNGTAAAAAAAANGTGVIGNQPGNFSQNLVPYPGFLGHSALVEPAAVLRNNIHNIVDDGSALAFAVLLYNSEEIQGMLIDKNSPTVLIVPVPGTVFPTTDDNRIFNTNIMLIVVALCKVLIIFRRYANPPILDDQLSPP